MGGRNELPRALDSCIQRPNNNPEGEEKIQSGKERRKDNDSREMDDSRNIGWNRKGEGMHGKSKKCKDR